MATVAVSTLVATDRETIEFVVVNDSDDEVALERFAFSSVCPVEVSGSLTLVERISTHHVVDVTPPVTLAAGTSVTFGPFPLEWRPRHADDGPCAFYSIVGDRTVPLATAPPALAGDTTTPPPVTVTEPPAASFKVSGPPEWRDRLDAFADLFTPSVERRSVTVHADASLPPGHATVTTTADGDVTIVAADADGATAGLRAAPSNEGRASVGPVVAWRGVHLDLARQWFPPSVVDRLIDTAARLGLNRVHLHLTDDEAWRFEVNGFPSLTEVSGVRGHGLAVPPLLGSGPAASGGWYSADDIAGWVRRAARLGVDLVPEIDLPGHCFAALQAVPELRDPDHTPSATSIQGFVGNVLYPGLSATRAVLDAALGSLVDLFGPTTIHLGGDEVPEGCWTGSPAVAAYAAERGLEGEAAVQRAFMAELAAHVRDLGCTVAVWEEAAPALEPGSGHVLAWTSHGAVARLADEGHDVVACPAAHWYLDLAVDDRWATPGTAWAGHLDAATAAAATFGSDDVVGAQACLWTEYVPTPDDVWDRYHPRLDRLAERMWRAEES